MNKFFKTVLPTLMFPLASLAQHRAGDIDSTFGTNGQTNGPLDGYAMTMDANDRVLVGECYPYVPNPPYQARVSRYTINGSLDPSYGTNGLDSISIPGHKNSVYWKSIAGMVTQPDGKTVLAMTLFNTNTGNDDLVVARRLPNGGPDTSFNHTGYVAKNFYGQDVHAFAVALDPSGKALVTSGTRSANNSVYDYYGEVTRVTANGPVDSTFGINGSVEYGAVGGVTDASMILVAVAAQPDGKVLVGGWQSQADHLSSFIKRLNNNGTLNTPLQDDSTANTKVMEIGQTSTGKIFATQLIGNYTNALKCYNMTGSLNNVFGNNGVVLTTGTALAVAPDGKPIVASSTNYFTWPQFPQYSNIIQRYNLADGTPDTSFGNNGVAIHVMPASYYQELNGVRAQSSGKIVTVMEAQDSAGNRGVSLNRFFGKSDTTAAPTGIKELQQEKNYIIYPVPAVGNQDVTLEFTNPGDGQGKVVDLFDMNGKLVNEQVLSGDKSVLQTKGLGNGNYTMIVRDSKTHQVSAKKLTLIR